MSLRDQLVKVALEWQAAFGNAPAITGALAEYDVAMLVGCTEEQYKTQMVGRSTVARGHDFKSEDKLYQIKANRPSGRKGSKVTLVGKPKNYDWDYFVWVHYETNYYICEVWRWSVNEFREKLGDKKRLSPADMRKGLKLFPRQ
jgi:hypothetical protein